MYAALFLLIAYFAFATVNIVSVSNTGRLAALGERVTKPFLMPLLILVYLLGSPHPQPAIVAALTFGFLGDVFLLGSGVFFMLGLAAFLLGHLCYIFAFVSGFAGQAFVPLPFAVLLAVPYAVYGFFLLRALWPSLGGNRIPCAAYAFFLLAMSYCALLRFQVASGFAFWLPFAGSVLFVLSDSVLAWNNFGRRLPRGNLIVMATYVPAQLLIMLGFLYL